MAYGKRAKRYIVEIKGSYDSNWVRSYLVPQAFPTKEEAVAAMEQAYGVNTPNVHVRTK